VTPVRPEPVCAETRREISALLDGELNPVAAGRLESHLEGCAGCSTYKARIEKARSAVRLELVESVPDMADEIIESVSARGPSERRKQVWTENLQVGLVAAVVAALLIVGSSLPGSDRPPAVASANEIGREIRAAAGAIGPYRAGYDIVERGWHPLVHERNFHAEVAYAGPDLVRLVIRDLTAYPNREGWPVNDVELVANGSGWWLREPLDCPPAALPGCGQTEHWSERAVVRRQPFDGSTPVPTDMILPLESVANSDAVVVEGRERIRDHEAVHVSVPYLHAQRLIASLQFGGSWRAFHPLDRVDIWLDPETSFPLRFTVTRGDSPERAAWARDSGYRDVRSLLYDATLTSFRSDLEGESFRVPRAAVTRDGGFRRTDAIEDMPVPRELIGLSFYTSGVTKTGERIAAWARGMHWLKMSITRPATSPSVSSESITVGGKIMYYRPASSTSARQMELRWGNATIVLESNLERASLVRIAASLPVQTSPAPRTIQSGERRIERGGPELAVRYSFVSSPAWLPAGYEPRAVVASSSSSGTTVSVYHRRSQILDGSTEIRITHSDAVKRLWPSSERYEAVRVRGSLARFSAGRTELEWVEDGAYHAISAPGFDLATIVAIAESM
jgi:hypothetical protein